MTLQKFMSEADNESASGCHPTPKGKQMNGGLLVTVHPNKQLISLCTCLHRISTAQDHLCNPVYCCSGTASLCLQVAWSSALTNAQGTQLIRIPELPVCE